MDAGSTDPDPRLAALLSDDPEELFENAPCGYLSARPDGTVVKVNRTLCGWLDRPREQVLGARFDRLLSVGGRVLVQTHLVPLLRTQGEVREMVLDLIRRDGSSLPCLVHAREVRDPDGVPLLVRLTLFDATARRRYERELLAAQRAAEESEVRSRTLQRVVGELSAAVTPGDVAAVVARRSRRAVGARAAGLWLVDEPSGVGDGEPRVALAAQDGLGDDLVRELDRTTAGRVGAVLSSGVRSVPVGPQLAAAWPALAAALTAAGHTGLVVAPVAADDRLLGALAVFLGPGGSTGGLLSLVDPTGPPVLEEADVDLLATLGRQAGQALERARLHEVTRQQAERSGFLLDAARLLAGATGVAETVERLAEMVVPRLADMCLVDLVTEQGMDRAVARHGDPARQHLVDELRAWAPPYRELPHPARAAMEQGRTRWFRDVTDEWLAGVVRDPAELAAVRALELSDVVSVPLQAEGRTLGVLTLSADRRRRPFTAADVELAEQLAVQVAMVTSKAQRFDFELQTSHTLQATLLPPGPPAVPGLAIAVRYLAATQGADIGGDFYDVAPLSGDGTGQVAIAVGDVVGHDITAAATMGQLRSVYRALLVESPAPSVVVDRLQASWPLLGLQRMATALFAVLSPADGGLTVASAGHPPPLVVGSGRAGFLPVRPSPMLGAAAVPAATWRGVLTPGDTLVLYTDGLVESRTSDIDEGLERLREAAVRWSGAPPDELVDRLLTELTGTHRADDIALLALTCGP